MKKQLVSALLILLFSLTLLLWVAPGIYALVVAIIQGDQTEFPSADSVELTNLVEINWESAVLYDSHGEMHPLGETHGSLKGLPYLKLTTVEEANRSYAGSAKTGISRISFDLQQRSDGPPSFCNIWLLSNTCVLLEIVAREVENPSRHRTYWYAFKDPGLIWEQLPDAAHIAEQTGSVAGLHPKNALLQPGAFK